MDRYHFHATDGRDLILDRAGRLIHPDADPLQAALATAAHIMSRLPGYRWRGWQVVVHDQDGALVGQVAFPAVARSRMAVAA